MNKGQLQFINGELQARITELEAENEACKERVTENEYLLMHGEKAYIAELKAEKKELDESLVDMGKVIANLPKSAFEKVLELEAQLKELEWIKVEDGKKPEKMTRVIVAFKNSLGKPRKAVAEYIPKRKVLAEDFIGDEFEDFTDYDKENDIYYAPEGFYEYNFGSELFMHMGDVIVTHYMKIPTLPERK